MTSRGHVSMQETEFFAIITLGFATICNKKCCYFRAFFYSAFVRTIKGDFDSRLSGVIMQFTGLMSIVLQQHIRLRADHGLN